MTEPESTCAEVDANMSDLIDGVAAAALFDHVAGCERCRDARYAAERLISSLSAAGADYRLPEGFEARLLAAVDAEHALVSEPRHGAASGADAKTGKGAEGGVHLDTVSSPLETASLETGSSELERRRAGAVTPQVVALPRQRWAWLSLAAAVGLGLLWLGSRSEGGSTAGTAGGFGSLVWQGEVLQVERAFGSSTGLSACARGSNDCHGIAAGARVPAGTRVETDGLTRALVKFADGSVVALDRASRLELDPNAPRRGRLLGGNLIAEVEKQSSGALAVIDIPLGRAEVLGTKFALSTNDDTATVAVSRGEVKLIDQHERAVSVLAGETGALERNGTPRVEALLDLGQAFGWRAAFDEKGADEGTHGALGQLTAKRPRDKAEMNGAVRLVQHHVDVHIVDNIARTEVEEVFDNQSDDVLEGIYRFPLPAGAQIERLALDVDGKLEEGAFVDRERGAAIWRGAIVNAGADKPKPTEEIIWVPGRWKDPALLEWQRGNRFELRIFPIPRRGSRRIVLAYTEVLPPAAEGRQYVYPLPRDPAGSTRIDQFTVDVQVRGHDLARGVEARGYPLKLLAGTPEVARLAFAAEQFAPAGDLIIGYQLHNEQAELRAWAYQPSSREPEPPVRGARPMPSPNTNTPDAFDADSSVPADAPYVAIALRPTLPRRAEAMLRDYVFVADSSRSMIGENYRRAARVIARSIAEMDRHDRVTVLACDSVCQSLPGGLASPGDAAADAALRFLDGIEPEGASDLTYAVEQAVRLAEPGSRRALRIVYVGDGTPTVGPIHPALVRSAVSAALSPGSTLSAVAIGSDADQAVLRVATDAGGGVTVPFAPGRSVEDVAYAVLGATYGQTLENARLELPDGFEAVVPENLGSIAAGAEEIVVARLRTPHVTGRATLRGRVAGAEFEQSFPIEVVATSGQGNAFVPRLYAATAIAELERSMDEGARRRSIALSTEFNVASRYTSLLVLESPAMFRAFGLSNQRSLPEWSGDQDSHKSETWSGTAADNATDTDGERSARNEEDMSSAEGVASRGAPASLGMAAKKSETGLERQRGTFAEAPAAAPPAKSAAPAPEASGDESARDQALRGRSLPDNGVFDPCACRDGDSRCWAGCRREPEPDPMPWRSRPFELPSQRLVPMRRVWDRIGQIDAPPLTLDASALARRAQLDERHRAEPLSRSALKGLYASYFLAGELERASELAELWSEKDPLDPDALTARADLAAQRGQRDRAIRILGSVVDVRPSDHKAQWRLARLHRWSGDPARGCRHSLAVAQLMLRDPKLVAEAVACARDVGQTEWVDDLLAALDPSMRQAVGRIELKPHRDAELSGDFRVRAEWQGAEYDLDLVIVHPEGYRVSWLGAPTEAVISATDVLNVHREGLALRGAGQGRYAIELVRSSGAPSGTVRGTVELHVADRDRSVPFVLDGDRVRVATAKIDLRSRLVPLQEGIGR